MPTEFEPKSQTFTTVFGDRITVQRTADVDEQFQYNISDLTLITTVANGGTVTQADNMAVLTSSTNANGKAELQSRKTIRYRPGFEGFTFFTAMFPNGGVNNSIQHIGAFANEDGYFIGYTDNEFVVGRKLNSVRTEVRQNTDGFNGDKRFENIDLTKLNVFRITWGWLGSANIVFQVLLSTGEWINIHTMETAGILTQPHSSNPNMPVTSIVEKTSSDSTNIIMKTGSWCGGVNGIDTGVGDRYFTKIVEKTISTAEAVLVNFRNLSTFQTKTNRVSTEDVLFNVSSEGTKPVLIKMYKNLSITSPSWADIDATNSVTQFDIVGTVTPDDDNLLFGITLGKTDSKIEEVGNKDFIIYPGETITITTQTASGSSEIDFIRRWKEHF